MVRNTYCKCSWMKPIESSIFLGSQIVNYWFSAFKIPPKVEEDTTSTKLQSCCWIISELNSGSCIVLCNLAGVKTGLYGIPSIKILWIIIFKDSSKIATQVVCNFQYFPPIYFPRGLRRFVSEASGKGRWSRKCQSCSVVRLNITITVTVHTVVFV